MQMQQADPAFEKIMNFMNGFTELLIIKNVFGDFETLKTVFISIHIQR